MHKFISCLLPACLIAWSFITSANVGWGQDPVTQVAGRSLEQWASDLDSQNRIVRLRAVKSLGPFGSPALSALQESLDDDEPGVRYWAAYHLGALKEDAASAIPALKKLKADEDHPGVQLAAAYALCRIDDIQPHIVLLTERLSYPERGMACSAADLLGMIGPDAAPAVTDLERAFFANSKNKNPLQKPNADYHINGACQNALRLIVKDWKPGQPPAK